MKENITNVCNDHEEEIIWQEAQYRIVRCKRCNLIYQNPQPNVADLYQEEYFLNNYIRYRNERLASFRTKWRGLKKHLPPDGRLLDVGSGVGFFLKVAKENNWQVIGIEPSSFARKYSEKEFGLEICQDISMLIGQQYKFDVITVWDVIAHLSAPYECIEKITSLLKPGGFLIIKTPYWRLLTFKFISVMGKFIKTSFFMHVPHQLYYFNDKNIKLLFQKEVFKVVKLQFTKDAKLRNVSYSKNRLKHIVVRILKNIIALINGHESFILIMQKEF